MYTQRRLVVAIALSQLINYTIPLLTFPILVKSLTIVQYGMWIEASTVIGLTLALTMSGLQASVMALVSSDPKRLHQLFSHALYIFGGLCIGLMLIIIVFAPYINRFIIRQPEGAFLLQLTSLLILTGTFNDLNAEIFRQRNQGMRSTIFATALPVARLLTTFLAAWKHDFILFVVAYLVIQVLITLIQIGVAYRGILFERFSWSVSREIVSGALILAIVPQASWLVMYGDRLMLSLFSTTSAVAIYAASYQITAILSVAGSPFLYTLLPNISQRWVERDTAGIQRLVRQTTRSILILLLPAIVGLTLLADPLLHILATPDFAQGWFLMLMLATGVGLSVLSNSLQFIFYAQNRSRILRSIYWQAALFNVLANVIAIPAFGYNGAGATTLISFAFIFYRLWRETQMPFDALFELSIIWRCLLAAFLMGLWVLPISAATIPRLFAAVVGGAIIYGVALLGLRVLTVTEVTLPVKSILRSIRQVKPS